MVPMGLFTRRSLLATGGPHVRIAVSLASGERHFTTAAVSHPQTVPGMEIINVCLALDNRSIGQLRSVTPRDFSSAFW